MKQYFLYSLLLLTVVQISLLANTQNTTAQIVNMPNGVKEEDDDDRVEKLMVSNFANIATNAILAIQTSQQNPGNPSAAGQFFLNMIQSFLNILIEAFKTKNLQDITILEKQLSAWCYNLTTQQLEDILLLVYEKCIDASADFKQMIDCYECRN